MQLGFPVVPHPDLDASVDFRSIAAKGEHRAAAVLRQPSLDAQLTDLVRECRTLRQDNTWLRKRLEHEMAANADREVDDARRAKLLTFAAKWAEARREYRCSIGYGALPFECLTNEALELLAERICSDFWTERRSNRINRSIWNAQTSSTTGRAA